jgi:hypothetical protein
MNCRYCNKEALHFVPWESHESNERAIKFITISGSLKRTSGVVNMCDTCYGVYGEYIKEYYGPRFELRGAL